MLSEKAARKGAGVCFYQIKYWERIIISHFILMHSTRKIFKNCLVPNQKKILFLLRKSSSQFIQKKLPENAYRKLLIPQF